MWVALPFSAGDLLTLESRPLDNLLGHAATAALAQAQAFEVDSEEAERAAAIYASLVSLIRFGQRIVVVADVDATVRDEDDPFGHVEVPSLAWSQVTSVFADEAEVAPRAAELATRLSGLELDEAWDRDDVHDFLAQAELMWFDPTERHLVAEGA